MLYSKWKNGGFKLVLKMLTVLALLILVSFVGASEAFLTRTQGPRFTSYSVVHISFHIFLLIFYCVTHTAIYEPVIGLLSMYGCTTEKAWKQRTGKRNPFADLTNCHCISTKLVLALFIHFQIHFYLSQYHQFHLNWYERPLILNSSHILNIFTHRNTFQACKQTVGL